MAFDLLCMAFRYSYYIMTSLRLVSVCQALIYFVSQVRIVMPFLDLRMASIRFILSIQSQPISRVFQWLG